MASVYILFSKEIDKFYIGSCNNLTQRLWEHNNKIYKNAFTGKANDWILFYSYENLDYQIARKIEQHIKNMKSRIYYSNLVKYSEIMEKLIDKYKAGSCR
ncbi:GIY-YIG nuclease family protein [Brumimicrobium aurantiacum]|uniref:GIY-YIG nuclease family protein n=1 Tax=Brumimicrobium aurantiacum TaxID=1737063 RepID=A0A3E1EUE1_9FLAO|nr:GIY-YIG nuclease family protein [Brumimicrobium aurantiacum]